MKRIENHLNGNVMTVSGHTISENIAEAECYNDEVILPYDKPLMENGGIAVLRGNLAPQGAIVKPSAASEELMSHSGRAIVFEDLDVPNRSLQLHVSEDELAERRKHWQPPEVPEEERRGYASLYRKNVMQADTGADFDFLLGKSGAKLPKSSH